MTNFPNGFDDDTTLPFINDNITQEGAYVINALRDVAFSVEQNIGLGAAGSTPSIAARLGVSLNPDGTINPSALTSLGLVTLPITQDQIAPNAMIPESKLMLDHRTQDLFNYIRDLSKDVNLVDGWISITGIKLEPHLLGAIYRHALYQIDVTDDTTDFPYMDNKFRVPRDNSQSYNLINDLNNEFLYHQWADGYSEGTVQNVITLSGTYYPSNYAHYAGGIFINPSRFTTIPQTASDLQSFADYIDNASIFLLGTRIQNLYANGISKHSTSSSLVNDGYGAPIVPITPAIAYLLKDGYGGSPFDDINMGDDIIQFMPTNNSNNLFDEQFAQVRVGDIVTINYGTGVEVQYVILEKKYIQSGGNKTFIVRIASKNLQYSANAVARIDRPLFNINKYGCLATTGVNGISSGSGYPASLIVSTARGAQALGIGFTPDEFNETHFMLYLAMYPDGNPSDGYVLLPGIDVTGNAGTTPGSYTLDSIVAATNAAFRQPGYNYRFVAFEYEGNFGIMMADSYNNASFSIMSAVVDSNGVYNQAATQIAFPNNVLDLFPTIGTVGPDPLGIGPFGANLASPPYLGTYSSAEQAIIPTKVFVPLQRNNFYVNGVELERMSIDVGQILDAYGDGYWFGQILNPPIVTPGVRVSTTYTVNQDLSASQLKPGKTLVVQSLGEGGTLVDFGRYIIQSIEFTCNPVITKITVYDAVHAQGMSPAPTAGVGTTVALYFNSDSASFNEESATDWRPSGVLFKRHFEVYVDQVADTYTHERGRMCLSSMSSVSINDSTLYCNPSASTFDIVRISPKLRGYQYGSVNKIAFYISSYSQSTGVYDGYLAAYDGTSLTHTGPYTTGKIGEVTRFYDESNIDFIDFTLSLSSMLTSFNNAVEDVQLFPTLALDGQIMLISTCQLNDSSQAVEYTTDQRQFGNISTDELSTEALDYIALPTRTQHFNGVVRGFDITNITNEYITLTGGMALVNGNFQFINQQIITIPKVQELYSATYYPINFALCVSSEGELVTLPLTDYDSVLGTPNAPSRVVTLHNVVTGNNYASDSDIFSAILNGRKDLAALYIISSTVTGSGSGAVVNLLTPIPPRDVRRYVNDIDASIPAILTDGYNQGNFRNLDAALNWLKFNSAFQNTLQVKGIYSIGNDPGLNFPLNIEGAGATAGMTFTASVTMSEVNFIGVGVAFSSTLNATDVTFDACIVNLAPTTTLTGVAFTDCTINVSGPITTSGIVAFTNCIINVTVAQPFTISSGLTFDGCTFNYNFNPNPTGGPVAPGYVATDLVNAGSGLMYANITGVLNDFTVANCTFISYFADHFPFISLQLGGTSPSFSYGAIAQNVAIQNNKFIALPVVDDIRAVIAITSTVTTPNPTTTTYPPNPKLVNCTISENVCNYDQMIVVSTVRTPGQPITGSMLGCVDTKITDNVCGVIAYMNGCDFTSNDFNSVVGNIGTIRDKSDQLVIERNTCKMIANLDSAGQYITFRATETNNADWVKVGTGACAIRGNTVNWILVGQATWTNDGYYTAANAAPVIIDSNVVTPGNIAILPVYQDSAYSGITPPAIGILLRADTSQQSDYYVTTSVISNNLITAKTLLQPNGVYDAYGYAAGLKCEASANINGNTITHVVGGAFPIVYLAGTSSGGPLINFSNNTLVRGNIDVLAYIEAANSNAINQVSITDNFFDSTTVNGIANTNVGLNIPQTWTFCRNKNQTFYVELPLLDTNASYTTNLGGGALNTSTSIVPSYYYYGLPGAGVTYDGFAVSKVLELITLVAGGLATSAQYVVMSDNGHGSTSVQSDYPGTPTLGGLRTFTVDIPVDRLVPPNTRIVAAKLGAYAVGSGSQLYYGATDTTSGSTSTSNGFSVIMMQYNNILTSNSANGVLDVAANFVGSFLFSVDESVANTAQGTYYINSSGNENAIKSATQYASVNLAGQEWITGNNYRISAEISASYQLTETGAASVFLLILSPLVLTCVYQ